MRGREIVTSKEKFTIAYDGSAIVDGSMDVRDLAPALLAVGQLFDAANTVIYGDNAPPISVNVVATQAACFEVDLVAAYEVLKTTKDLLLSDNATALATLFGLIAGGTSLAGGLIWLIKKLNGKNPDSVEALDGGQVKIKFGDDTFVIPMELLRLYRDLAVRKAVEKVVHEPLEKDGIDDFKILDAKRVTRSEVDKREASYFVAPAAVDKMILKQNIRSAFSIHSLAFKEDNKWRLYDGSNQINALIEDVDFLRKVDQNLIRFAKGDILVCNVTVEQLQTTSGLKTNYVVNEVVEHIPAMRQLDIFTPDEKPSDENEK